MTDIFSIQNLFFVSLLCFAVGAVGSLIFRKNNQAANFWGSILAILGSAAGLFSALSSLLYNKSFSFSAATFLPILSITFGIDYLSAFFVLIISTVTLCASVYALGYVKHYYGKYNIGTLGFFYNIFIASVMLVFTASNGIFFLIVWEIMALTSYAMVVYERRESENIRAGSLYFIMTHIGTAFIILFFLLLFRQTGSFNFSEIKDAVGSMSPTLESAAFFLAVIGFGVKAGIIPLHIWLPSAHPAAPSHVSAILSGVMIKTGIYMFIRVFFDFLPNAPLWWGFFILAIGATSSLLGVLYALAEHDIKRLLAYHSIENIGIILLGLGSALTFLSLGAKPLAAASLIAALFHTLNHAIFKALLFLGAGAVVSETHTRNIEEYGGLIKYMPQTALFFLVGSMAISALPPFNGFVSEWIIFQSLFVGIRSVGSFAQWMFIMATGSLAFTGGLAAACFVKAFGAVFLARPRSEEAKHAREAGLSLRIGMGILAILTLVLGIFAGSVLGVLAKVAGSVSTLKTVTPALASGWAVVSAQGTASISTPIIFAALLCAAVLLSGVIYLFTRKNKTTTASTWDCGTALTPRMEITATGFSRSIVTIFNGILKSTKQHEIEYRDESIRYFQKFNVITVGTKDIYRAYLYKPLQNWFTKISDYLKNIQTGNINSYVLYIFVALIGLLILLVI